MGLYQKTGVRKVAIYAIEAITWIRIYGFKDGMSIFRSLDKRRNSHYEVSASFLKNRIRLRDNYSDKAIFRQVFFDLQYKLDDIVAINASRIIDAGANIGFGSLYFSKVFPGAEIVAIEPENENFNLLKHNTRNYKNIRCLQAALWNKNEMVSIANPDSLAASFMVESKAESSIQGITIGQLLEEQNWDRVDIVKIDIEGAEKEVFSADNEWLRKTKLLIVELHDRYKADCTKTFFRALENYRYEAYFQHENIFVLLKQD